MYVRAHTIIRMRTIRTAAADEEDSICFDRLVDEDGSSRSTIQRSRTVVVVVVVWWCEKNKREKERDEEEEYRNKSTSVCERDSQTDRQTGKQSARMDERN